MNTLMTKIRIWYRGKYVPSLIIDDPNSGVFSFPSGQFKRPFIAKLISNLGKTWNKNWKDILIIILTFLLLIATIILILKN